LKELPQKPVLLAFAGNDLARAIDGRGPRRRAFDDRRTPTLVGRTPATEHATGFLLASA
jgi:hypothetical protein